MGAQQVATHEVVFGDSIYLRRSLLADESPDWVDALGTEYDARVGRGEKAQKRGTPGRALAKQTWTRVRPTLAQTKRRVVRNPTVRRVRALSKNSRRAIVGRSTGRKDSMAVRIQVVLREFDVPESGHITFESSIHELSELLSTQLANPAAFWLAHVAIAGTCPDDEEFLAFYQDAQVNGLDSAMRIALAANADRAEHWSLHADMELVTDVAVDATRTAHQDMHTGIQRVVRETIPRWTKSHPVQLLIWDESASAFREPNRAEEERVMRFDPNIGKVKPAAHTTPDSILVPWKTTVVIPEPGLTARRAAVHSCLGSHSGSETCFILYDMLPYIFPETFVDTVRLRFGDLIHALRATTRISTISHAVADDARDFCRLFGRLGLPEPEVCGQPLAESRVAPEAGDSAEALQALQLQPGVPLVLSVGSIEPRKNQIMALRAAERLWNEGQAFQLMFIGWNAWHTDSFEEKVTALQAAGKPVRIVRSASDDMLSAAYKAARFSVYVSIAEGHGLPPSESLAAGTPVVLSDIGSMHETGSAGGAEMVNPHDLNNVVDAMRLLLTDDAHLAALTEQISNRPHRTWDDYAAETWDWLINGVKATEAATRS